MTTNELREMILKHIRDVLLVSIDDIKHCRTDVERAKNKSRRDTLFELHSWINEETRLL